MAIWADFVPKVAMYVADCPHFTIAEEAQKAAIEFYRDSRAWRSSGTVTLGTTVANQANYTIINPAGQELVGLPAVWLDGVEIAEARPGDVNDITPGMTGTKHKLLLLDGSTVKLLPATVTAGRAIVAQVAYAPTAAATGISDALFALHFDTIRNLILCGLKGMQGKPWSDAAGARAYDAKYQSGAADDGSAAGPVRRNRLRTKMAPF